MAEEWLGGFRELSVPHTQEPNLISTLGDPVKIRSWQVSGLLYLTCSRIQSDSRVTLRAIDRLSLSLSLSLLCADYRLAQGQPLGGERGDHPVLPALAAVHRPPGTGQQVDQKHGEEEAGPCTSPAVPTWGAPLPILLFSSGVPNHRTTATPPLPPIAIKQ